MKRFLHFSFLLPAILFITHQVLQKVLLIHIPLIDFYLDPFCFSALVLPLFVWERKVLFNQATISKLEILILVFVLVLYSEAILPHFFEGFISDLWDVLMIVLGGMWFYATRRKLIR